MDQNHTYLCETHSVGPNSRMRLVHWGEEPILLRSNIEAIGLVEARVGYEHFRPNPRFAILYVALEGEGQALVDGRWVPCPEGHAYLMPKGKVHGYRAVAGVWRTCWVIGRDPSLVDVPAAALRKAGGQALAAAIGGFVSEHAGDRSPAMLASWCELVHAYALRIGRPSSFPSHRLQTVWERVSLDLARDWDLADLARIASLSEESVRRVCRQETGRTPLQQVTDMRMRTAASFLRTYPYPIDRIAAMVGYRNAFAFSVAFKRWSGVPPSRFRLDSVKAEAEPSGDRP